MKLTIEISQDEQLRNEILKLIAAQIKNITGDEIKKMAQEYLNQVNVAAKVSGTIKDLLNKQIDVAIRGYGDIVIKKELDKKFIDWVEKSFNSSFERNVKGYIKETLNDKLASLLEITNIIKKNK